MFQQNKLTTAVAAAFLLSVSVAAFASDDTDSHTTRPPTTQPTTSTKPGNPNPGFNPMSNATQQLLNTMFKKGSGGSIYYPNSGKLAVKCLTVSGMPGYFNMTMKQISVSGQIAFSLDELTQANGSDCQTAIPTPPTDDPFLALINGTGTQPTGTQPTGTQPTGTQPTGTQPTGTQPTGTQPTGTQPTGTQQPQQ